MVTPKVTVDTRNFDRAFKEYMLYSKRDMSEIVNTKAYFIARGAVNLTKAADPQTIEGKLLSTSRVNSNAPLVAILVNKQRAAKGLPGLSGAKMGTAIRKYLAKAKRSANFLRSGWIPAIKELSKFAKGGPAYKRVKTYGVDKGGAKGSPREGKWFTVASIWNSVTGGTADRGVQSKSSPDKVQNLLMIGLQKAVNKEESSMRAYVEKKLQQRADKFNRS